jgi:hypothetical protein
VIGGGRNADRDGQESALVWPMFRDCARGHEKKKQTSSESIRAKAKPDEMLYLHLTQRHTRLRKALLTPGLPIA